MQLHIVFFDFHWLIQSKFILELHDRLMVAIGWLFCRRHCFQI